MEERRLAVGTIAGYLHVARLFLAARAADGGLRLEQLTAAEVTEFVLAECATRSVGSSEYVVCGLRSLLRYLFVAGHIDSQLDTAVPTVASWRLARLPVTFGRAEVGPVVGELRSADHLRSAGIRGVSPARSLGPARRGSGGGDRRRRPGRRPTGTAAAHG